MLQAKACLMDEAAMGKALSRMAHEIVEKNCGEVTLVGIRRRGVPLANRLAALIERFGGGKPDVGELDVTLYRDDLSELYEQPRVDGSTLTLELTGRTVVLVDDVLFTGRTARAAMDALMDHGRPSRVELAVLVDRGHRELPIRADFVGKNIPTSMGERVGVHVRETDGADSVALYDC